MIAEKKANNLTNGMVDMVWINGENFNNAKSQNLLYGPFATKIPSSANFDFESVSLKYDFGRTTNGFEMPYNEAEVVFIYNKQYFPSGPPQNIDELVTWVKANPGRFTYPTPQCFLASCPSAYGDCYYYDYHYYN
jgi:putative spermidine/putrescine transport system substrate-binding protein